MKLKVQVVVELGNLHREYEMVEVSRDEQGTGAIVVLRPKDRAVTMVLSMHLRTGNLPPQSPEHQP